jgi:hypothetical protein
MSKHSSPDSFPSKVANSVYREKSESEGSVEDLDKSFVKEENIDEHTKKLLNVGTQSEHRRTRSSRNTEFEELRFEVKPRRKMNSDIVTLKLEEEVKLIPKNTGENDVYQFI